jgi:hypothetical protein
VLPAVWSHHRHRRTAAYGVLVLLLRGTRDALRALRRSLPY